MPYAVGAGGQAEDLKKSQEVQHKCIWRLLIGLIFSVALIGSGAALYAKGHYQYAALFVLGVGASVPLFVLLAAQIWASRRSSAVSDTKEDAPTLDLDERSLNNRLSCLQSDISFVDTIELEMTKLERTQEFVNSQRDNDSSYWTGSINSCKLPGASTPEAFRRSLRQAGATEKTRDHILKEESSGSVPAALEDHSDIGSYEGSSNNTPVFPVRKRDVRIPLSVHSFCPKHVARTRSAGRQDAKKDSEENGDLSAVGNGVLESGSVYVLQSLNPP